MNLPMVLPSCRCAACVLMVLAIGRSWGSRSRSERLGTPSPVPPPGLRGLGSSCRWPLFSHAGKRELRSPETTAVVLPHRRHKPFLCFVCQWRQALLLLVTQWGGCLFFFLKDQLLKIFSDAEEGRSNPMAWNFSNCSFLYCLQSR